MFLLLEWIQPWIDQLCSVTPDLDGRFQHLDSHLDGRPKVLSCPQWVSRSPPNVIKGVQPQGYWYVWHITYIDTDQFRNATNYAVHRKFVKWWSQQCVPPYGSAWAVCVTTRESVHLWLESCTPSCEAWPFPSFHASTKTLSPHSSGSHHRTVSFFLKWVRGRVSGIERIVSVCGKRRWSS
jgi:hypothetical protein